MAGANKKGVQNLIKGVLYTKSEAHRETGVSRPTINQMILDGRLEEVEVLEGVKRVKRPD